MYAWELDSALTTQRRGSLKVSAYATVVYMPPAPRVDFGLPSWPPSLLKRDLSPRMMLVSTWTDGRWGFIGGGARKCETPIDALNREFAEETGSTVLFSESDFCFCHFSDKQSTFVFCRITTDLGWFNSILSGFYSIDRPAYPDEVLAICGYPIWLEGPIDVAEVSLEKQVHGLPRHLVSNGGLMTPTLGSTMSVNAHGTSVVTLIDSAV